MVDGTSIHSLSYDIFSRPSITKILQNQIRSFSQKFVFQKITFSRVSFGMEMSTSPA